MNIEKIIFAFGTIATFAVPILVLAFWQGPMFDESLELVNQAAGHHGMLEIGVHNFASLFFAIASLVAIMQIYIVFGGEKVGWPAISGAFLFAGLIGAGEVFEHFLGPFGHDFFHYLHMIGAPVAMFFLWVGMKELIGERRRTVSMAHVVIALILVGSASLFLGSQAETPWDKSIELPFFYITAIPALILGVLCIKTAYGKFFEFMKRTKQSILWAVSNFIFLITLGITFITLDIFLGRVAAQLGSGQFYVLTHALQDVLHVVNGTLMIGLAYFIGKAVENIDEVLAAGRRELKKS
jgi:hypothetical protein